MKKVTRLLILLVLFVLPFVSYAQCTISNQPVPCGSLSGFLGLFAGLGFFVMFLVAIVIIISILVLVFWVMMLIHAATKNIKDKTLWIVLLAVSFLLGLHLVLAIVYYFAVKKPFDQKNPPTKKTEPQGFGPMEKK